MRTTTSFAQTYRHFFFKLQAEMYRQVNNEPPTELSSTNGIHDSSTQSFGLSRTTSAPASELNKFRIPRASNRYFIYV